MKRAKDKYMINRTKYKDIKRYDHKQKESILPHFWRRCLRTRPASSHATTLEARATTMNKSEKYSEIILLGQMLQERKIEHEQHDLYDGYQITVPLPEPTKEISVIEHQCSYGSIMNLLEIWADGSIQ